MTWKEQVYELLENLGGHAYLKDIYNEFLINGKKEKVTNFKASIRDALEKSSSDSEKYDGDSDLLYMVEGKGHGHWGIKNYDNPIIELTQEDDEFEEGKESLKDHLKR
ncbi:MAG: restriction endonuclease, partial [Clostridia bacterium]